MTGQAFVSLTIACSSAVHTSVATTASAWACTWGEGACWQGSRLVKVLGKHQACERKKQILLCTSILVVRGQNLYLHKQCLGFLGLLTTEGHQ